MPETKEGRCPWCERDGQTLYYTQGAYEDGSIWVDYICGKCLLLAKGMKTEAIQDE